MPLVWAGHTSNGTLIGAVVGNVLTGYPDSANPYCPADVSHSPCPNSKLPGQGKASSKIQFLSVLSVLSGLSPLPAVSILLISVMGNIRN